MCEKRKLSRLKLLYHLRVFDRDNFKLLGHLADIHTEGMMIISEQPQNPAHNFNIKIALPVVTQGLEEIYFSAQVLWCQPYVNPIFYQIGFKFEHIDKACVQLLETLTYHFGFQGIFQSKVVQYYRGIEGYNCAQAILKVFQRQFDISEKQFIDYAAFGGGRAQNGICGALYSVQQLAQKTKTSAKVAKMMEQQFKSEVGSIYCDEILSLGRLSCTGCIFTAYQILQSMLKRS